MVEGITKNNVELILIVSETEDNVLLQDGEKTFKFTKREISDDVGAVAKKLFCYNLQKRFPGRVMSRSYNGCSITSRSDNTSTMAIRGTAYIKNCRDIGVVFSRKRVYDKGFFIGDFEDDALYGDYLE
ncbi:MAG: hypothetical protein KJ674_01145 [Nanoarchaeota archaeon]|nr:hypothetical protein [Nanoarchaeota archaeon]